MQTIRTCAIVKFWNLSVIGQVLLYITTLGPFKDYSRMNFAPFRAIENVPCLDFYCTFELWYVSHIPLTEWRHRPKPEFFCTLNLTLTLTLTITLTLTLTLTNPNVTLDIRCISLVNLLTRDIGSSVNHAHCQPRQCQMMTLFARYGILHFAPRRKHCTAPGV